MTVDHLIERLAVPERPASVRRADEALRAARQARRAADERLILLHRAARDERSPEGIEARAAIPAVSADLARLDRIARAARAYADTTRAASASSFRAEISAPADNAARALAGLLCDVEKIIAALIPLSTETALIGCTGPAIVRVAPQLRLALSQINGLINAANRGAA